MRDLENHPPTVMLRHASRPRWRNSMESNNFGARDRRPPKPAWMGRRTVGRAG